MSLSVGFALTCRCAGCGTELDGWQERVSGTGEPLSELRAKDGGAYLIETRRRCPKCPETRVRVTFRIG